MRGVKRTDREQIRFIDAVQISLSRRITKRRNSRDLDLLVHQFTIQSPILLVRPAESHNFSFQTGDIILIRFLQNFRALVTCLLIIKNAEESIFAADRLRAILVKPRVSPLDDRNNIERNVLLLFHQK